MCKFCLILRWCRWHTTTQSLSRWWCFSSSFHCYLWFCPRRNPPIGVSMWIHRRVYVVNFFFSMQNASCVRYTSCNRAHKKWIEFFFKMKRQKTTKLNLTTQHSTIYIYIYICVLSQWRPFWFSSFTWNSTTFMLYFFSLFFFLCLSLLCGGLCLSPAHCKHSPHICVCAAWYEERAHTHTHTHIPFNFACILNTQNIKAIWILSHSRRSPDDLLFVFFSSSFFVVDVDEVVFFFFFRKATMER